MTAPLQALLLSRRKNPTSTTVKFSRIVLRLGGLEVWRFGGLEVWRFGGLEVWRFGGLEAWRFGGLEVWRFGGLEVWRGDTKEMRCTAI